MKTDAVPVALRFEQIWYGDTYREFRRRLDSSDPPEVCRGCSLYRHTS